MEFFTDSETWVAAAFILVVALIAYKGWPVIRVGLDERAAKIRHDLDEAARLKAEAERALAEFQRKQRDAMKEAEAIVTHAREEAQRAAERAERDLAASLERRRQMASEKIALEEAKALTEVRNLAVEVAIAAVRRVLAEELDAGRREKLVDDAIAGLPQALH